MVIAIQKTVRNYEPSIIWGQLQAPRGVRVGLNRGWEKKVNHVPLKEGIKPALK